MSDYNIGNSNSDLILIHFVPQELRDQMPGACDILIVAAQNLVTAQQGLKVENFRPEARKHLIRTAKDILEGTIKASKSKDNIIVFFFNITYSESPE